MKYRSQVIRRILATAIPLAFASGAYAQTPPPAPTVVIDGTAVAFDQPPVEQAGRIFVPLRGVFERLGASVVFQNGQINATSGNRSIGLHVGQSTAVVNGTQQQLESAPLLIGGRVLVPLRFIAEALGATVNFDSASQTAYIAHAATPPPVTPTPAPPAYVPPAPPVVLPLPASGEPTQQPIVLRMVREEPANGSSLVRRRPEISATFSEAVDANSLHLSIDGRDVTSTAYVSERGFVYDPSFEFPAGPHRVLVTGRTPRHEPFENRWTFTTTAGANDNFVSGLEPPNGFSIASPLSISGLTRPGSRVRVVATASETIARFSENAEGSVAKTVTADGHGYFEAVLEFADLGTGLVDVRVESTAPNGGVAVKTLRLRT